MIYIVNNADDVTLAKFEAWDINCEDKAIAYIKENNLRTVSDEITALGDRIVRVVK